MSDDSPIEDASANGGSNALTAPRPIRFSLRTVFLLMAVVAVILGVGSRYVVRMRGLARASQLRNDLKQVYLGLLNYESAKGALPRSENVDPQGNLLSSWRLTIAPYMESWGIRWDNSAAWDAPTNRQMASITNVAFCWDYSAANPSTSIFAVTGADTAFDRTPQSTEKMPEDLVLLIEVADSMTHWMQPGDYKVGEILAYHGKIGEHLDGVLPGRRHVLFADGEIWALDPNAPIADLQPFLTITGAKTQDRDQLLGRHRVN
jgi:hypothetical protein